MNIKIMMHIMPWEIDHALLIANKLKQSSFYINSNDKIYVDTVLNLSSKIIDWDVSILKKEYFIDKYNIIINILKSNLIHQSKIYDGDLIYGHLNLQKEAVSKDIDAYIAICPDIHFNEHLLYYLIDAAKQIENEYFLITPQIFRCWDDTWDCLVHDKFKNISCSQCIDVDIHEIEYHTRNFDGPELHKMNQFKFAGWFDLYSKNFYEKLVPVLPEWNGYGPWDFYSMTICNLAKQYGVDVQEYVLTNQVIWFYDVGSIRNFENYGGDGQLKSFYKKQLSLKLDRTEQKVNIEKNFNNHIKNWHNYAIENKIIYSNN
jgi:hypothetical protein